MNTPSHVILISITNTPGWSGGIDSTGKVGYFPTDYVQILATDTEASGAEPPATATQSMNQGQSLDLLDISLNESQETVAASSSYGWLVTVISFYAREVCVLLRIVQGRESVSVISYHRATICEVEKEVVAGLLRIFVCYMKVLEKSHEQIVKQVGGQQQQVVCMRLTLTAITSSLVPRAIAFLENVFEGEHAMSVSGMTATAVLEGISKKASQLIKRLPPIENEEDRRWKMEDRR